ncbi:MAG TPA: cupin domain-containing protein, partial [Gaiellaceae bacterium]|nr:cupin domain-containing protein [Gaiellaceae bacterium]
MLEHEPGALYVRAMYNVFTDELDVEREDQHPGGGYAVGGTVIGKRLAMKELGVTLYVLPPGNAQAPYHWHHVTEELLLVLGGRPTLRSPDGERQLDPGDMVAFPHGPEGAHKIVNGTSEPARYLIFSTKPSS